MELLSEGGCMVLFFFLRVGGLRVWHMHDNLRRTEHHRSAETDSVIDYQDFDFKQF